ncbi:T9SS type B sorting domain-containing protein [Zunongwangia sp. F363]|uniref:T9SS type B sorting domain-containing protein n=1 Tax=Autumnicola tepida TaxID=3075595 RepID=A0ABU3CEZ1_9FLAO|nr:T9SS type B sorting domain-containing protein [Zunongwangia sp. F363]MDT0644913.1 T9SS type B sorting domain-containing protein [Zunongwangia sp. F363]
MKTKFLFITLLLFVFQQKTNAQEEAAVWYFGDHAGLSFNTGAPVALNNGRLQTVEGSASIADKNGNLLFYTDGSTVYDRNHNVMRNGDNLKGDVSSTQSAIVVPRPRNPGHYFIFTIDKPDYYLTPQDPIEGVNYSEVDMSLNRWRGAVLQNKKNIHLITYNPSDPIENEFKSSEKISAVIGGDCMSYWVVTQFMNKFFAFKVTPAGVNSTPVVSVISNNFPPILTEEDMNVAAAGYLKISPDGTKIAAAYAATSLQNPGAQNGSKKNGKIFLYDFDDLTGKVSNETLLKDRTYPYGVEFSPSSSRLYATINVYGEDDVLQRSQLLQYDLESPDIANSEAIVHASRNVAGALQLAIDGKIYRAGYPTDGGGFLSHNFLSVINNPENAATNVDYDHNSIDVSPNNVKLGLPPFVQSLFNNSFDAENFCLGDITEFSIDGARDYDSVEWDFGDGTFSSAESPTHIYSAPGTFTVTLTKFNNNIPQDPVCKEITIIGVDKNVDEYTITQCDVLDNNPNDGLAEFNLQLARDYITGSNNNLRVLFYEDLQSANYDNLNQNGLSDIYRNTNPNQVLIAKVTGYDSECAGITRVRLETSPGTPIAGGVAVGCEIENGEAEFDLASIENNIRNDLGLPQNVELSFHTSENDAILGEDPLPETYISDAGTLNIRANAQGVCYGFGTLELQVVEFPDLPPQNFLQVCNSEFPVELGADIILPDPGNYNFQWNTGETSNTIMASQAGIYTLTITNKQVGCGRTVEFSIEERVAPEITNIEVNNNGATSVVTVNTDLENAGLLYALDDENGSFQSTPVFRNVPGGTHTVFVQSEDGCVAKEQQFSVFGYPSFFTPNNDGYNDEWKPFDLDDPEYDIRNIYIFDRYGQLLKQLDPEGAGWNGIFNGQPMPSDDYWFSISFTSGKEIKGHFSLKRSN